MLEHLSGSWGIIGTLVLGFVVQTFFLKGESRTWYHVAFTFNAGTVVLYVNGIAVAGSLDSGAIPSTLYAGTADVIIGAMNAGGSLLFSGKQDAHTIYSYVPAAPTTFAALRYNEGALLYGKALI